MLDDGVTREEVVGWELGEGDRMMDEGHQSSPTAVTRAVSTEGEVVGEVSER